MTTCDDMYNCCDCGVREDEEESVSGCGCSGCYSCNACDNCYNEQGDCEMDFDDHSKW